MKPKNTNTSGNNKQGHSHAKHMWMMAICCGLPIIGFLAIGALGINAPSLETLIALICPIGMVAMMYMMNRDKQGEGKGHSCCQQEETEAKPQDNTTNSEKQAGSFKA